jgi:hypothetical protein
MTQQPRPTETEHEDERSRLERRFSALVRRFWEGPPLPDSSPDKKKP